MYQKWYFGKGSGLCGRNCLFVVLKSPKSRSGTILDRPDAAVKLKRGAEIPIVMLWHASGSSNGCFPTR
eukprot:6713339-Pyramimonas_sp.AAC.1